MKISELPPDVRAKAEKYRDNFCEDSTEDNLENAFEWMDTKEGMKYWCEWQETEPDKKPTHYDNTKGSLYQFCENQQLNSYEFDIIKRVMRCRKKGNFIEDLEKTKFLIDLYIKEYEEKNNR
jgi:hypothetical protein